MKLIKVLMVALLLPLPLNATTLADKAFLYGTWGGAAAAAAGVTGWTIATYAEMLNRKKAAHRLARYRRWQNHMKKLTAGGLIAMTPAALTISYILTRIAIEDGMRRR